MPNIRRYRSGKHGGKVTIGISAGKSAASLRPTGSFILSVPRPESYTDQMMDSDIANFRRESMQRNSKSIQENVQMAKDHIARLDNKRGVRI